MVSVCFYFQVHQPFRLRDYRVFDIGKTSDYFDERKNREVMQKVAEKCYIPAGNTILDMIEKHKGAFKVAFSITGVALDQFEAYSPHVIDMFKKLSDTGCVEFLSETYYHSLSSLYSPKEFAHQIGKHRKRMRSLFGQKPMVFRNTELICNNEIAKMAEDLGYKAILAEGADHIMGWRSPNFIYRPKGCGSISLMLKNYKLSDDIAFRFSNRNWKEWPLTAPKFADWINGINGDGEVVNLFMDYETLGEHQWEDTGIFSFMRYLPAEILKHKDNSFVTPSQAVKRYRPIGEIDMPHPVSWADIERDTSAWRGNRMQDNALANIYQVEEDILKCGDAALIDDWRRLQTSDHYYYMCTKWFEDGDVHKYFSPYDSPYDAFIAFSNAFSDLIFRINEIKEKERLRI